MKTKSILLIASLCLAACGTKGDGTNQAEAKQVVEADTVASEPVSADAEGADINEQQAPSWEDIPDSLEAMPLNFDKWLVMMKHIQQNWWARPTAEMLSAVGLKRLYETDSMDEDSIKNVHFIYGRQVKRAVTPDGDTYHASDGDHAVLFEVFAGTSSYAEILFHHPADLRDFMQQAIQRGVATSGNGSYIVCEEPMDAGVHTVKAVYRPTDESGQGQYHELYYLEPAYQPDQEWYHCHVSLDLMRCRLDVE